MGFKADTSFLRFLTMGARGTQHVIEELHGFGFEPIELERYSTSNKIWSTKIKRLRLPDLLCVKTGLRVEVRAKASLEIRMSHAPNNPDRHWDTGLRDEDVIALITCGEVEGSPQPSGSASFFGVRDLRGSVNAKQLSALKAASEGSEQYLTWPSIISPRPGKVLECTSDQLVIEKGGDGEPPRKQTYQLRDKRPYVGKGDVFVADTMFLAGTPSGFADLRPYLKHKYRPLDALRSENVVDRYSAVKAIAFRPDEHDKARPVLAKLVGSDQDERLALEVAGSAAALGIDAGIEYLQQALWNSEARPMRMEAVFITTEVGVRTRAGFSREVLAAVVADKERFGGDEVRQAALWGLGHAGVGAYRELLPYLADDDENVALHAIAAFGPAAGPKVIARLVESLGAPNPRLVAAASEALRNIGNTHALRALVDAARASGHGRAWVLATLGRLPEEMVRQALTGDKLLIELAPILLLSSGSWLSAEDTATSLRFLLKQVA